MKDLQEMISDTRLRFEAARFLNMKLVGVVAGVPLFNGTPEQLEKFHKYIATPTL